jgi:hypothetical protein
MDDSSGLTMEARGGSVDRAFAALSVELPYGKKATAKMKRDRLSTIPGFF